MSQLGLGVMIQMLNGDADSVAAVTSSIGKKITAIELNANDTLCIKFENESELQIMDDGQSCCEHRYMTTDDNLQSFIGDIFIGIEIKGAPNITDEYGDHECEFLEIKTNKGCFTMTNHNEHNGYYGGFYIKCNLIGST